MNRRRMKLRIPFTCVTLSKVFSFDLFEIWNHMHRTSNIERMVETSLCHSALLVSKKFLSNHIDNANFQRIFKCHKTSDWDLNEEMAKMWKDVQRTAQPNKKQKKEAKRTRTHIIKQKNNFWIWCNFCLVGYLTIFFIAIVMALRLNVQRLQYIIHVQR